MKPDKTFRFSALTVTVSYLLLSMIALALFAMPILYAWHGIVEERSTERLHEDSQRLSHVLNSDGEGALRSVIHIMVESQPVGDEKFILLASPDLQPVMGNLPAWPRGMPDQPGTYTTSFQLNGETVRAIFVRSVLAGNYNLIVGRNTAKFQTVEKLFWLGLFGSGGMVILIGILGRRLIRGALLSQINEINMTTTKIVGGDLTRRLVRKGESDELNLLADTINRMLDQIVQLIDGIRNVSNSIAHDLRTPLTELRFRLEKLTLKHPDDEEVVGEIDCAILDVDRVILIFNALLRLAEIEHGAGRSAFGKLNVKRMAEDVIDLYQPLAEMKEIHLSLRSGPDMTIVGDSQLLAQALGNLIDNALKYARTQICVEIKSVQHQDGTGHFAIIVSDDGSGISDDEKSRVVERFYRGKTSSGTGGVGLGLSLVAGIAKLHGGFLEMSNAHPGLHATLSIPRNDL